MLGYRGQRERFEEREDLGYHYNGELAHYRRLWFQVWYETDFHVWPRAGGLMDQDPLVIEDFLTMLHQLAYIRQEGMDEDLGPAPPSVLQ